METSRPLPSEHKVSESPAESEIVVPDTTETLPDNLDPSLLGRGLTRVVERITTEEEQPTELDIEKSHEIKPDQTQAKPQPDNDTEQREPVRVGAVVASLLSRQPGLSPAVQQTSLSGDAADDDELEPDGMVPIDLSGPQPASLYKQAIRTGFICAVILILFMAASLIIF